MLLSANALIIKDGEILMVKKRDVWIFPGGKIEESESDLECLSREVSEELSGTKIYREKPYGKFFGRTPYSDVDMEMRAYFAEIDGDLNPVSPGDSISESEWIKDFKNYNLTDVSKKVIFSLRRDGYLE